MIGLRRSEGAHMRGEYSAIAYLLTLADDAKRRGDYAEFERLRRQYLTQQARIYAQVQRERAQREVTR